AHLRCRRPGHEASIGVTLVARGRARGDVHPAINSPFARNLPVLADAFELQLRKRGHDRNEEAAERGGRVDALGDGQQFAACVSQALEVAMHVDRRAPEAVEPRDHDALDRAALRAGEHRLQSGARGVRAGEVQVLVDLYDLVPVRLGRSADTLGLHSRADEPLSLSPADLRDAHVAVESHRSGRTVASIYMLPNGQY